MDEKPIGTKPIATGIAGLVLASAGLLTFINGWEDGGKRQSVVYADKLAGGLPTACGGLTKHITTTPIIVGESWPAEKCEREQGTAIAKLQRQLLRCFTSTPPQSVFDAATSHAWNVGVGSTCNSGAIEAWNKNQWALGCRRLSISDSGRLVWSYVRTGLKLPNGKPEMKFVQGLANRRRAEWDLCMEDVRP